MLELKEEQCQAFSKKISDIAASMGCKVNYVMY